MRKFFMDKIDSNEKYLKDHPEEEADNYVKKFLQEMDKRQETGDTGSFRSLLGTSFFNCLFENKLISFSFFSKLQLYGALADLWGAGMETTATTLEWALLYLAKNTEVQKRVTRRFMYHPCWTLKIYKNLHQRNRYTLKSTLY